MFPEVIAPSVTVKRTSSNSVSLNENDPSPSVNDIDDGVRSFMSYVNAKNLEELRANSSFVKVTQNGMIEAKPHLLL